MDMDIATLKRLATFAHDEPDAYSNQRKGENKAHQIHEAKQKDTHRPAQKEHSEQDQYDAKGYLSTAHKTPSTELSSPVRYVISVGLLPVARIYLFAPNSKQGWRRPAWY